MIVDMKLGLARMVTGERTAAFEHGAKKVLELEALLKDAGWTVHLTSCEFRDTYDTAVNQAHRQQADRP